MSDGNGTGVATPSTDEAVKQEQPAEPVLGSPLEAKIKAEKQEIQKTAAELQKTRAYVDQLETSVKVRQGRLNAFEELLKEEQAGAASGPGKVIPGRKGRRAGIA